ncbi:ATP-binding cassette domain-containing protein [Streptomyces sp. NPDC048291]|uniref:ATP-binding cassette domain-containing protein n=1 Tax=Streptomyces sp. NPDC048291 TaxID=3365530 RepID=UPI00371C2A90
MSTKGDTPIPLLAGRDLAKAHGRTEALRGASVGLRAGEILAVTGASGSGKSTLLHCFAGIVRPDAGSVTYAGERLDRLPEKRLSELRRTDFGVVFQFGQLIPELTALDNVALPLMLAGTARADARARAGCSWWRPSCWGCPRCSWWWPCSCATPSRSPCSGWASARSWSSPCACWWGPLRCGWRAGRPGGWARRSPPAPGAPRC